VLEEEEYLRRKEFYQESGQRHYYFMNVGNGEVIDACRKARAARAPPPAGRGSPARQARRARLPASRAAPAAGPPFA
jgi:hypothetical protein